MTDRSKRCHDLWLEQQFLGLWALSLDLLWHLARGKVFKRDNKIVVKRQVPCLQGASFIFKGLAFGRHNGVKDAIGKAFPLFG